MVRAGALRHRVTIQEQSATRDILGGRIDTWTDVATVWAQVRPVTGQERLQSDLEIATLDYLVRMRFRSDVTTSHRIQLSNGDLLDIERVIDVNGRGKELELSCAQRRPQ